MDASHASHGLGDPRLLDIIDKLVELNIGESVALPQVSITSLHDVKILINDGGSSWSLGISQGALNVARTLPGTHSCIAERVQSWRV